MPYSPSGRRRRAPEWPKWAARSCRCSWRGQPPRLAGVAPPLSFSQRPACHDDVQVVGSGTMSAIMSWTNWFLPDRFPVLCARTRPSAQETSFWMSTRRPNPRSSSPGRAIMAHSSAWPSLPMWSARGPQILEERAHRWILDPASCVSCLRTNCSAVMQSYLLSLLVRLVNEGSTWSQRRPAICKDRLFCVTPET